MRIEIVVDQFYDWEATDEQPPEPDHPEFRPDVTKPEGAWLKRTVKHAETHTTIGIPQEQIDAVLAHSERTGMDFTETEAVEFLVRQVVMPYHAPRRAWKELHASDPEHQSNLRRLVPTQPRRKSRIEPPEPPALWIPGHASSIWHHRINRRGRWIDGDWHPNTTTDTASGFTNRRDWQSKLMGGDPVGSGTAAATGTSTSVGTTSLTNTGAAFPTAGQGLAGHVVVTGSVFGIILSNTGTVLTIDRWYVPGTLALASNPATGVYVVLPGNGPAWWLALTADSAAITGAETTLASEITTGGLARAIATYSHTAAANTYQLQAVFNATSTFTVNKGAVFGGSTGGVMPFIAAEPNPPTVVNQDQLTQTVTVTI